MPQREDHEFLRALEEQHRKRTRALERNEGIAFEPGYKGPENPLGGDQLGGQQWQVADQQTAGYNSDNGLNIVPFTSDISLVPLDNGTAQAGATATLTLRAAASAVDDAYTGEWLTLMDGTGEGQIRLITDYDGTTKVATVDDDWLVVPDNTSVYVVGGTDLVMG